MLERKGESLSYDSRPVLPQDWLPYILHDDSGLAPLHPPCLVLHNDGEKARAKIKQMQFSYAIIGLAFTDVWLIVGQVGVLQYLHHFCQEIK